MGWKHQCRQPGNFRIWGRRARSGALWSCRCGTWWELRRRSLVPGHSHWEWALQQADTQPGEQQDDRVSETYSTTETAWRDPIRHDGERSIPDIQLGFQREAQC